MWQHLFAIVSFSVYSLCTYYTLIVYRFITQCQWIRFSPQHLYLVSIKSIIKAFSYGCLTAIENHSVKSLSLSLSHTHIHTPLTLTLTQSRTHWNTHTHTQTHKYTHNHTQTHTQILSLCLSVCLSLSLCNLWSLIHYILHVCQFSVASPSSLFISNKRMSKRICVGI